MHWFPISRRALCAACMAFVMFPAWAAGGFTLTDLAGRTVSFDKTPERFIVANYIANFMMIGGAPSLSKVVGMTQDGREHTRYGEYTLFTKAFPDIKKIPSIGGYHDNVLNAERILSLRPDVILINRAQYADNSQRLGVFEKAGIRVVVLDYHAMKVENHTRSTEILGRLLGRESIAQAQNQRYREVLTEIDTRIAALPDSAKHRRVYVECGNEGVGKYGNSYNGTILWGAILKNLGAAGIAQDMKVPYAALDREFVVASNPQTIVIAGSIWQNASASDQMRMGLTVDEQTAQARLKGYAQRTLWQKIDAVKNHEVYGVDHGSLRCMLDYTFSMYLAKVLYPQTFADYDPEREIRNFYATYLPELQAQGTFFIHLAQ